MATDTLTPSAGHIRLQLELPGGQTFIVGPFLSFRGARSFADDLIADDVTAGRRVGIKSIRCEHKNGGRWKPAWGWMGALALLLVSLTGCNESLGWTLWEQTDPPHAVKTFHTLGACNREAARLPYPDADSSWSFGYGAHLYHEPICLPAGTVYLLGQALQPVTHEQVEPATFIDATGALVAP